MLLSISSLASSSLYKRAPTSRCARRRRPFEGEQLLSAAVDVVQVVDVVVIEVEVVVANVTVNVVKKNLPSCVALLDGESGSEEAGRLARKLG